MLGEQNATGINPEKARREINTFIEHVTLLIQHLHGNVLSNFFKDLSSYWASNNAVAFYQNYSLKSEQLIFSILTQGNKIIENAAKAYNIVARANGQPEWRDYLQFVITPGKYVYTELVPEINGITGINRELVQNILLPALEMGFNNALTKIDGFPQTIALFDVEGSQQNAFRYSVENFKNELNSYLNSLKTDINAALTQETDRLELAKQMSTEAMSA